MAFEINHLKMVSSITCDSCRSELNVYSDDQRTIDRSIVKFQESHTCDFQKMKFDSLTKIE